VDFSKGSSQALMGHIVKKKLKERERRKEKGGVEWGGGVLVDLAIWQCGVGNL